MRSPSGEPELCTCDFGGMIEDDSSKCRGLQMEHMGWQAEWGGFASLCQTKESIKKITHRNECIHEGEIGIPFLGPILVYGSDC